MDWVKIPYLGTIPVQANDRYANVIFSSYKVSWTLIGEDLRSGTVAGVTIFLVGDSQSDSLSQSGLLWI